MDLQSKRKLLEVIRGIIGSGFDGTQQDICEVLESKGYEVTQSTVSRCMKQLGVVKVSNRDKTRYELKQTAEPVLFRGSMAELVTTYSCNESTIVLKTTPGSAMFVAGFVDHHCRDEVLGTVAGDDTIFIAPITTKSIKKTLKKVQEFLMSS